MFKDIFLVAVMQINHQHHLIHRYPGDMAGDFLTWISEAIRGQSADRRQSTVSSVPGAQLPSDRGRRQGFGAFHFKVKNE